MTSAGRNVALLWLDVPVPFPRRPSGNRQISMRDAQELGE